MTTTEQIQALQNAVNNLATQINAISGQLSSTSNNLNLHMIDAEADIATINGRLGVLSNEDIDIHEEIHQVANAIDNHTGRINYLEVDSTSQDGRLDALEQADVDFQEQITDMEEDIHDELHLIANAIDNNLLRLRNLEIFAAETPNHVVLSESQYDALGTPDYDTYYFVYEED